MEYSLKQRQEWFLSHKEEILEYYAQRLKNDKSSIYKNKTPLDLYNSAYACISDLEPLNCDETIGDIDLHSYLENIRYCALEKLICLIIKDKLVISEDTYVGKNSEITSDSINMIEANFIKAKEHGGDIYICHNHPYETAARLSGGYRKLKFKQNKETCPFFDHIQEINNEQYIFMSDVYTLECTLKELEKKYNIKLIDFAVVCPLDYASYAQTGSSSFDIDERPEKYKKRPNK